MNFAARRHRVNGEGGSARKRERKPTFPRPVGGAALLMTRRVSMPAYPRDDALSCAADSPHIRPMAKTPGSPKTSDKTPKSKVPKSKAHRPDVQPIGPALADLLNPAINRGDAGMGSGTGLQPPPDNS